MTPPNVIFVPTPASPQSLGDLAWYNPNAAISVISSYRLSTNLLSTSSIGTNRIHVYSTDVSSVHPVTIASGAGVGLFLGSGIFSINVGSLGNATIQNDILANTVAVKITVGGVEYVSVGGTGTGFGTTGVRYDGFDFSNLSSANIGDSIDFEIYY